MALVDDFEAFFATNDGVLHTTDAGKTFADSSSGLAERRILHVTTDGSDVYAVDSSSSGDNVYSWNGSGTWDELDGAGQATRVDLTTRKIWVLDRTTGSVRVSNDGGDSWTTMAMPPEQPTEIDASSNGTVIVGRLGAARSAGGGWRAISALAGQQVTDIDHDGIVWYISTASGGVYRSVDDGLTFLPASTGMPPGPALRAYGLAIGDDEVLYGSLGDGAYRSVDDGDSWSLASDGLTGLAATDLHVHREQVYSATSQARVWRYRGAAWTGLEGGLESKLRVNTVGSTARAIVAGTVQDGIWRSTDNGSSWSPASDGLPQPQGVPGAQEYACARLDATQSGELWVGFGGSTQVDEDDDMIVAGGVAYSSDGGVTWRRQVDGLPHAGLDLYGDFTWKPVTLLRAWDSVRLAQLEGDGLYHLDRPSGRWTWAGAGLPGGPGGGAHAGRADRRAGHTGAPRGGSRAGSSRDDLA